MRPAYTPDEFTVWHPYACKGRSHTKVGQWVTPKLLVLVRLQLPLMICCLSTSILGQQQMSTGVCRREKRRQMSGFGCLQGRGRGTYGRDARVEGLAQSSVGPSFQDDSHRARQQRAEEAVRQMICGAISGDVPYVGHAYCQWYMRLPVLDLIDPLHTLPCIWGHIKRRQSHEH